MSSATNEQSFAWQGWAFPMPRPWSLHEEGGDVSQGFLRIADEEALRLEIVWQRRGGKPPRFTAPPRGWRPGAEAPDWLPKSRFALDARFLETRRTPGGDSRGILEILLDVPDQGRNALMRIFTQDPPGPEDRRLVKRIVGNLAAPALEQPWPIRVYRVDLAVPGTWRMIHRQLGAGLKRFVFDAGRGRILHLNALSLAARRKGPARDWIAEFLHNAYPAVRPEIIEPSPGAVRILAHTPWRRRFHLRPDPFRVRRRPWWHGRWFRAPGAGIDYLVLFGVNRRRAPLPWNRVTVHGRCLDAENGTPPVP